MKYKDINTLVIDVDGVLTDGSMIYTHYGEEARVFNVHDFKGLGLAKLAGIGVILMTSSKDETIIKRAIRLGNDNYLGIRNKLKCLHRIIDESKIGFENVAFIGDDINDISVLREVGLPIAVGDAVEEVRQLVADKGGLITNHDGGNGAVREAIEYLLKMQERWADVVEKDIDRQLNEEI